MIEMYKDFIIEYENNQYKCKYFDYGETYARLHIKVGKKNKRKKYYFFGPEVEYIEWIEVKNFEHDPKMPIIHRRQFYDDEYTINLFKIKLSLNRRYKEVNYTHTEKIVIE